MNREGHKDVTFFYGTEVEHTPAYGKYTLFVVGVQNATDIAQALTSGDRPVEHIYFGANMSFPNIPVNNGAEWTKWETIIYHFLDKDIWCTLDVDISCVEGLCESGLCEHNHFVPMISAKLPYVRQLGYNATLKIDDKDFKATNPGVWCHSLHTLQNQDTFTHWSKYEDDSVQ